MLVKPSPVLAVSTERRGLFERHHTLLCAALILLVSLVAVSSESLWIDECVTAHVANQPTLKAAFEDLVQRKWTEVQLPLYMAYAWGWTKIFGSSEWALRFSGVPWFAAGGLLFVTCWRERSLRTCACLVVALSPFSWFYLNEARYYSSQIGLVLALIASLVQLRYEYLEGKPIALRWLALFCFSVVVLSMMSALGMIWAAAAFLVLPALFPVRELLRWVRDHWALSAITAVMLLACAAYYQWTRRLGAAPTELGYTNWQMLASIVYEQLGFNGLGPGRLALREGGMATLKPWLPLLAIYGAAVGVVLLAAARELYRNCKWRELLLVSAALSVPALFIITLGFTTKFRVLGRHFTPTVGIMIVLLSFGLFHLLRTRTWWSRAGIGAFILLTCASCLSQRFGARHARDDYRAAAEIARACLARGQSVWWNANSYACEYYHIPSSPDPSVPGKAWIIEVPGVHFQPSAKADVVIASAKTDVYDRTGVLHEFLRREGYRPGETPVTFVVFHRRPTDTASKPE